MYAKLRDFFATQDKDPLPNPYADPELCLPLPNDLHHWLYERTKYVHMCNVFVHVS